MVKLRNINDLKRYWSDGGRKLLVSCHKDNPRLISSDYIYRKIHKNAKRQPLSKLFTGESASRKKNGLPKHSHTRTAQPTR